MNLQQFRYLLAVVDHGTMTDAARRLHVSQPALSRAIRGLEAELNVSLLERVGRNVQPAPGTEAVLATIREICAAVEELQRQVRDAGRTLTICTSSTTEALLFAHVIPAFIKTMPSSKVQMVHSEGDAIESTVVAGGADFGITDRHPHGAVEVVKLADQEIVLASPLALSLPDPVPRALLDEIPLIVPSSRSARHVDLDELLTRLGVAPPVALETDERSAWANAVSSGIGSALTLASAAAQFERTGIRLRSFEPPLHSTLYLIRKPGSLPPAAETFLRLIVELLG